MRAPTEQEFLDALKAAYDLGAFAAKKVNFGRNGFTHTDGVGERRAINRLLRKFNAAPITEAEHDRLFND